MVKLDDDEPVVLGPCTRCDHGWVTVGGGYVDDHARLPDHVIVRDEAERDELVRVRRVALAESVYPCKVCRPSAFFRWAKGCGTPGHDSAGCDLCQREAEKRGKRR